MVYPLRFSFISPVFMELPFLFLVKYLQRLIGICRPGDLLYGIVYCSANTVDQRPRSVPYCRLVLLIRLVLFQYGYVADVPLDQTLRGQPTARRNHDLWGDFGEPFFREVNGSQMIAYFGWRLSTYTCFTDLEMDYLQVVFQIPGYRLERDYQPVQLRIDCEGNEKYYGYDSVGDDGERMIPANLFESAELSSRNPRDCMVDGGSIPTQAADSVSIYPDSLDDMEQKIGSSVKGGMEQETAEKTHPVIICLE